MIQQKHLRRPTISRFTTVQYRVATRLIPVYGIVAKSSLLPSVLLHTGERNVDNLGLDIDSRGRDAQDNRELSE